MHSRWLFALGIATGVLLSVLAGSTRAVERGARRTPDGGHEAASATTPPRALAAPSRLAATPRLSGPRLPEEEEEEENRARYTRRQALDEAFRSASREARDEAWAEAMEKSVRAALDQVVAAAPVAVSKPDCRTQHCQFDLEWLDRDAALTAASDVLAMLPGECARTITHIDDEQDEYESYKSRVLLDCPRSAAPQR
jgi:hypothetical protein